jgi:hypothetical protein
LREHAPRVNYCFQPNLNYKASEADFVLSLHII